MKKLILHLVFLPVLGGFLAPSSSHALHHPPRSILEQIRRQEPTLHQLVTAAFKEERLNWDQFGELERKIKRAPWLPQLSMGYDRQFRKYRSVSFNDNISVTSNTVTVGPPDNNEDYTINNTDVFHVRAVWDLSELVFHPATLKLKDEARNLSKARLDLTDTLSKIYSERRRLLAQYFLVSKASADKKVYVYEQIQVLAEKMDALTGSVFADRWWKRKGGP